MATAVGHVCSGLALSCEKRNLFLNHPSFSPLSQPTSPMVSSPEVTCQQTYFAGQSFTPLFVWPKDMLQALLRERKRAGDPEKKKHRRRKGTKKKKLFKIIRLVSAAGTGFFYAKKKSRKSDKLELKKYDPKVKRHVVFTEVK